MNVNSSFVAPFSSHWRIPREQTEAIIKNSLIVLDSSVLLSLYRVTMEAREEMIGALRAIREQVWIPHQVAVEFHKNRITAAKDQESFYKTTRESLEKARSLAAQSINQFANRCALQESEKDELHKQLNQSFEDISRTLRAHEERFDLRTERVLNADPVLTELADLLDGRVGTPFTAEEEAAAQEEATRRMAERIPPGYLDRKKGDNPAGDFLWWEQTLIEATQRKQPVLIVSNDEKEDWLNKQLNYTVGPRQELIDEMRNRADSTLQIVNFATFLRAAKASRFAEVSTQTLRQAKNTGRSLQKTQKPLYVSESLVNSYRNRLDSYVREARGDLLVLESQLEGVHAEDELQREALQNRVRIKKFEIELWSGQLQEFNDAVADSTMVKGDIRLRISDPSLRSSVLNEILERRKQDGDDSEGEEPVQ
ncbi:PIN-like domain-containing protein [Streptomyces decoyicus]